MSEKATQGPEAARLDAICLILSAVGGFADAGSFILIGSFTGHLTGNALLTSVYLVKGQFTVALSSAAAVAAFLSGTAAGTAWRHESGSWAAGLMLPLIAEAVLIAIGLAVFDTGGLQGRMILAGAVCFALGLQNGTLDKLGSVSVHSTYITGMSTSLVSAILMGKAPEKSVLPKVIACFLIGALSGAVLVDRFGETGYALVLLPLCVAIGLTALSRRRSEASG